MAKEYPALTVSQSKAECEKQISAGNGDKKILISCDDEGNGYHGLFYSFMSDKEMIESYEDTFHDNVDPKDVILLG